LEPYHSSTIKARGQSYPIPPDVPAGVPGSAGTPAGTEAEHRTHMALSITCHVQNPVEQNRYLLCGIDSLHLGLFVNWCKDSWPEQVIHFQEQKEKAFGTNGVVDQTPTGRTLLHLPTGKPPRYRFHLQFPEHHIYLAMAEHPKKGTPNVYACLGAETLWQNGIQPAVELLAADIVSFGGSISQFQPSRCDIAADFLIPSGITHDFLMAYRVTRSRAHNPHFGNKILETAYFGDKGSPILLRIYDKSLEVMKSGTKNWFWNLWGLEVRRGVWLVEYQLRRDILRQFEVDTLDDLYMKIAGIWKKLTTDWFSLRLNDNDKPERRTVHPLWQMVQSCADRLGDVMEVQRTFRGDTPASREWLVSHISGCVTSLAARMGNPYRDQVFIVLQDEVSRYCPEYKFQEEYIKRRIKLNRQVDGIGGDYENTAF